MNNIYNMMCVSFHFKQVALKQKLFQGNVIRFKLKYHTTWLECERQIELPSASLPCLILSLMIDYASQHDESSICLSS